MGNTRTSRRKKSIFDAPASSNAKRIEFFIRHAGRYLQWVQIEGLSLPRGLWPTVNKAVDGCVASSDEVARAVHAQHRACSEAHWLDKVAPRLAEWMEDNDHDPTDLLLFMHGARGGGGPLLASEVWPRLKVALQRLLLKEPHSAVRKPAARPKFTDTTNTTVHYKFVDNDVAIFTKTNGARDAEPLTISGHTKQGKLLRLIIAGATYRKMVQELYSGKLNAADVKTAMESFRVLFYDLRTKFNRHGLNEFVIPSPPTQADMGSKASMNAPVKQVGDSDRTHAHAGEREIGATVGTYQVCSDCGQPRPCDCPL